MSARSALPSGMVTFLFTDIEGSTRLAQLLGPAYRLVLAEHRRLLRRALRGEGGVEVFAEGDAFFFAFSDAGAALRSCRDAQRALRGHRWPSAAAAPKVRMGLHSGRARPRAGEYASPQVHRAARIAAAAHGGQVLCSAATAAHGTTVEPGTWLRDLGLHRLRGFDGRERLFQLVAPGLAERFPGPRTEPAAPHNLPAPITSFIGRAAERAHVAQLLERHRLVTVAGAGGAGKTRLAIEVAAGRVDRYPDGVWFVDLASVTEPRRVAAAVAAVLGLRPEPGRPVLRTVAEYSATRRFLLVLDTCDAQLAAAVDAAAAVLSAGPGPRLLTTSREPMGIAGEVVWRIPPLSLSPSGAGGPREGGAPEDGGPEGGDQEGGGQGDAVALLADRAATARGGVAVAPAELPQLRRVAAGLGGLPLAIELAAARLRVLTVGQLADRVDAGPVGDLGNLLDTVDADVRGREPAPGGPVPAQARHATLGAAVRWSYRTLAPGPARLLRALSVFAGPVDLPTAEYLLDADPLPALTGLVEKSLLEPVPVAPQPGSATGGSAYRMLEPIRAFAARELVAAGERRAARQRHGQWVRSAVTRSELGPDGQPVTQSLHRLDPYADEARAALHWCVTNGSARHGLRLAAGLDLWWRERGLAGEGRRWLVLLYDRAARTGEAVADPLRAEVYRVHSGQAGADGEYAEQLRYARRAEEAARRAGDPGLLTRVRATVAWSLADMARPEEAERICRELLRPTGGAGAGEAALAAVTCLAQLLWRRSALDEAAELLGAARPVEQARPDVRGGRAIDHLLGVVALARGDLVAARDHLVVALRSRVAYGFRSRAVETLAAMAARCGLSGDPSTAARLFGAVETQRARLRLPPGGYGSFWGAQEAAVRAVLGDRRFDAAYGEGAGWSLAEAVAAALAVDQLAVDEDAPELLHPA